VIVGDGGFQMTNQELATIRQENVRNVKICIVNNGHLGMVRQWQELFENRVYSATPLSGPCFAQLAEAYGIRGITVERAGDVEAAFEYAKEYDNSIVIDFRVEQEANVFPIVPQGKSIGEMITA
jgi:acetolactate synthase-1/2/3 large subunit